MNRLVDYITTQCIQNQVVTIEQEPWLRYYLEKRIYTIATCAPIYVLCLFLVDPLTVTTFFAVFFSLRSYTSGYHAQSILRCFLLSFVAVLAIMLWLLPVLSTTYSSFFVLPSAAVLWLFSPYNDPKMRYSKDEIKGCVKKIRARLVLLVSFWLLAILLKIRQIVYGISLGLFLSAFLLALAYILRKKERNNEAHTNEIG